MKYPEPKPDVGPAAAAIDTELVEILAQLVTRFGLSEIEVAKGDFKIRVARQVSAEIQWHDLEHRRRPALLGRAALVRQP